MSEEDRLQAESAAAVIGVSVTEFVRQAARERAEVVLRDRNEVVLDDEAASAFLAAVDADAPPPTIMRELFARGTPW